MRGYAFVALVRDSTVDVRGILERESARREAIVVIASGCLEWQEPLLRYMAELALQNGRISDKEHERFLK